MLSTGEIDTIILCKPLEESGKSLGYIPGGMDEKIAPWVKSYKSNIEKIIGKEESDILFEKKIISFEPLAFMRGDTFDRSLMILDEAQNAPMKALMLFVTRMGKESKCIVAGDINQYDIKENKVSLPKFIEIIKNVKGVGMHTFTENDIVRAKILKDIVKKYDKWKYNSDK
jgi:phosphate starvation-inducible PhoH-like protein